jgi:hypothetical protein
MALLLTGAIERLTAAMATYCPTLTQLPQAKKRENIF